MSLLRRVVTSIGFYWFARTMFLIFAKLFLGLRVEGVRRVPRGEGLVVASNHFSTLDPPVMGASVPREVNYMAKKELFDNPAFELLIRGLRAFPVDRERSDVGAIKYALRRLRAGVAIGIFIQGTRNAGDAEALGGAAFLAQRAGVPLQPAAIWRDGRRFRVRFGEPFRVEGRGKDAVHRSTDELMARINALLPDRIEPLGPDKSAVQGDVSERETEASR